LHSLQASQRLTCNERTNGKLQQQLQQLQQQQHCNSIGNNTTATTAKKLKFHNTLRETDKQTHSINVHRRRLSTFAFEHLSAN